MSALSLATFGMMNAQNAATTAEQRKFPEVRAKEMVSKISNACGLQGDQVGQVNNLYIEYFKKLDVVATDAKKVAELNKTVDASLKGILSPSQLKFWQEASSK